MLKKYSNFIVCAGIFSLFLPKITIFSIAGYSTGLRLEDFILAVSWVLLVSHRLVNTSKFTKIEKYGLLYAILLITSSIVNHQSLLFAFRPVEYFTFFYIGRQIVVKENLEKIAQFWIIINFFVCVSQKLGWIGGFTSEGYAIYTERVYGFAGGPWESSVLINMIVGYFMFSSSLSRKKQFILLTANLLPLFFMGSRTPIFIHILMMGWFLWARIHKKVLAITAIIFVIIGASFGPIHSETNSSAVNRFSSLASVDNFKIIADTFSSINVEDKNFVEWKSSQTYVSEGVDTSWEMRTVFWSYAIRRNYSQWPTAFFIGIGPGFLGGNIDGSFVRIFSESGVIGLLLFMALLHSIYNYKGMRPLVACFVINMFMLDIFMSSKACGLLFLFAGFFVKNLTKNKTTITNYQ